MSAAAVLEAPATLFGGARRGAPAGGGRTTLAELLDETWRAARADADAECPMCHAPMHMEADAARCGSCGTTLT